MIMIKVRVRVNKRNLRSHIKMCHLKNTTIISYMQATYTLHALTFYMQNLEEGEIGAQYIC